MDRFRILLISFVLLFCTNSVFAQSDTYDCKNYLSDTSTTVILPFSVGANHFDKNFKAAIRPKIDLCLIEELFIKTINSEYFNMESVERANWIDKIMKSYKKQLIFASDKKGQLIVWINCMCSSDGDYWRTDIPIIFDGGPFFFNFKLNLSTKKYFDFFINSQG